MVMRNLIASAVSIQSMNRSVGEVKISFPKLGVELNSNGNYLRKEYVAKDRKERTTSRYLIYEEGMLQMELLYPLTFPRMKIMCRITVSVLRFRRNICRESWIISAMARRVALLW